MSRGHSLLYLLLLVPFLEEAAHGNEPRQKDQPVRTDHYGDPLPPGVRFRLGTLRLRHAAASLAWLPDGRTLASAGYDDTVRLWQIPGGKQLAKWNATHPTIFTPDRRAFVCECKEGVIRFVDLATGKELRQIRIARAAINPAAFSSDGKILAAIEGDKGIHLCAVETGREICFLKAKGISSGWQPVAFSPDRRTLVVAGEGGVSCWNTETGKQLRMLGTDAAISVTFSPDGKRLAAVCKGEYVSLRNWPAGQEIERFEVDNPDQSIYNATFSPDGKVLAMLGSGFIRLQDLVSGMELRRLMTRTEIGELAFSPDGSLLASAGDEYVVTVWEVQATKTPRPLTGLGHRLDKVALSADGRTLITLARDNMLTLWDSRDGRRLRTLVHWSGDYADDLLVSPKGTRALLKHSAGDESPAWWDSRTGESLPKFSRFTERITCISFSPDGSLLAMGGFGGMVSLRETERGREVRQLKDGKNTEVVCNLAFASDGHTLSVSHTDGKLILWDLATGRPRHRLVLPCQEHNWHLHFSNDGRLLAVVWKDLHIIRLFETVSGKEVRQLRFKPAEIGALAFAPDNRTLAIADGELSGMEGISEHAIRLWDLPTGKPIHVLRGHEGDVHTLAFSPDGASLISGSADDTVLCWDVVSLIHRRPSATKISAAQWAEYWTYLGSEDAPRAQRAVVAFILAGDSTLPFLDKQLPPAPQVQLNRLAALLADLDDEAFAKRENASRELMKPAEMDVPALRKALKGNPTLEARKRIENLLAVLEERPPSAERLRTLRALQVLETIGTPGAQRILDGLAHGASGAELTEEAKASLQRLNRRTALSKPTAEK